MYSCAGRRGGLSSCATPLITRSMGRANGYLLQTCSPLPHARLHRPSPSAAVLQWPYARSGPMHALKASVHSYVTGERPAFAATRIPMTAFPLLQSPRPMPSTHLTKTTHSVPTPPYAHAHGTFYSSYAQYISSCVCMPLCYTPRTACPPSRPPRPAPLWRRTWADPLSSCSPPSTTAPSRQPAWGR